MANLTSTILFAFGLRFKAHRHSWRHKLRLLTTLSLKWWRNTMFNFCLFLLLLLLIHFHYFSKLFTILYMLYLVIYFDFLEFQIDHIFRNLIFHCFDYFSGIFIRLLDLLRWLFKSIPIFLYLFHFECYLVIQLLSDIIFKIFLLFQNIWPVNLFIFDAWAEFHIIILFEKGVFIQHGLQLALDYLHFVHQFFIGSNRSLRVVII